MIDPNHHRLSIMGQCALAGVSRSCFYYQCKRKSPLNLKLMRLIDEQWLRTPFFGSRRMARFPRGEDYTVSRERVRRLMRKMGLEAVYPQPRTSKPHLDQQVHAYLLRGMSILLRGMSIERPKLVWSADITFLPMGLMHGFMYLVAVVDWCSRRVLSWRFSNTLEADSCVAALEDAMTQYGKPAIFNTGQGSQFSSLAFTGLLKDNGVKISRDGKGAWMDNLFIERLWWPQKCQCAYLGEFQDGAALRKGLRKWIGFYYSERPHSSLDHRNPDEAYFGSPKKAA